MVQEFVANEDDAEAEDEDQAGVVDEAETETGVEAETLTDVEDEFTGARAGSDQQAEDAVEAGAGAIADVEGGGAEAEDVADESARQLVRHIL